MRPLPLRLLLGLAPALLAVFALPASAQSEAEPEPAAALVELGFVQTGLIDENTVGWDFAVEQAIQATALGVFDLDNNSSAVTGTGDGLTEAHEVGLWEDDGTLLASVIVPSGGAGDLVGGFRYVDIVPVDLLPGMTYVLGVHYPNDPGADKLGTNGLNDWLFDFAPVILPGSRRLTSATSLTLGFPDRALSTTHSFGPNLLFVPEPGGVLGAAAALAGLLVVRFASR